MTTTNVTNGTTTLQENTTNMNIGNYSVNATFTDENTYNTCQSQSQLTINDPNLKVINCQSTDEFIYAPDGGSYTQCTNNLDQTGYITNIPNNYVACKHEIRKNMTITGTIHTNNNKFMAWGIRDVANNGIRYVLFTNNSTQTNIEEAHTQGSGTNTSANSLQANTDNTFTITINPEGYINYNDSVGNNLTSNTAYTSEQLQKMLFVWRHWNGSGRIILKQLTYQYNTNGG